MMANQNPANTKVSGRLKWCTGKIRTEVVSSWR